MRPDRPRDDPDGAPWMGPLPASVGCDCHVCRPDRSYAEPLDRSCIDAVLQHGWQVMLVSDEACDCEHDDHGPGEEPGSPAFAYTVGLGHRAGHPELLVSGLDLGLMHRMLNDVAERVLAGRRLAPGDVLEGVLGHVPVVVERATELAGHEAVTWSGWFHRREPQALVLVWPTTSGIFAWQPGGPEILDERQPSGWREPIQHGDGVAPDPPWPLPVPPDQRAFSCVHVIEDGDPVLYVARQSGGTSEMSDEDWTIHCGAGHGADEVRLAHVAHLVRSAPSLRAVGDLGLDEEAERPDPDTDWTRTPIVEE